MHNPPGYRERGPERRSALSLPSPQYPWFEYDLQSAGGRTGHHSLAIVDDESWCMA